VRQQAAQRGLLEAYAAAVALGDAAHDGQPQPAAGFALAVAAVETVEHALALAPGNARSAVGDLQPRRGTALAFRGAHGDIDPLR
jgi:hypothetical protein